MGYIGIITHLLTIDPTFQRDIQVGSWDSWEIWNSNGDPFPQHATR